MFQSALLLDFVVQVDFSVWPYRTIEQFHIIDQIRSNLKI